MYKVPPPVTRSSEVDTNPLTRSVRYILYGAKNKVYLVNFIGNKRIIHALEKDNDSSQTIQRLDYNTSPGVIVITILDTSTQVIAKKYGKDLSAAKKTLITNNLMFLCDESKVSDDRYSKLIDDLLR